MATSTGLPKSLHNPPPPTSSNKKVRLSFPLSSSSPPLCTTSLTHPALHPVLRAFLSYLPIAPKDQDGVTPLIAAVKNGHRDVVKTLLDHGTPHLHTPHLAPIQHVATYQVPTLPMPRVMASRSSTRQMPAS
jgi:hypothetical protein